jgi:hypothetical protein
MANVQVFGPYTFNLAGSWLPGVEGVWWWKPPRLVDFTLGTATVSVHPPSPARNIAVVETRSRVDGVPSERYFEFRLRNAGQFSVESFWAYITLVQP